jgi:hypothetical protein
MAILPIKDQPAYAFLISQLKMFLKLKLRSYLEMIQE